MARFGGGGGGGFGSLGDMKKLMQQAQKMQEDAAKLQQDLEAARIKGDAGGGMVTAIVNGHGHLVEIKINPIVVDPNDVEMLEDLVITAARDASSRAKAEQDSRMEEITGVMGDIPLPPGLI